MRISLSRLLALVLLLGPLVGWPLAAKADVVDTLGDLLNEADKYHVNPFPVSGNDVKTSKDLFNCLDSANNDLKVIACVEQYKDTPMGQKASAEADLPSWFWDLVDLYVDVRTHDYWGAVGHLGEAAICIVAQVMAEGTDVCGLVKDLVAAAKEVLEVGKAIGKFFASLGEGAWDAAKDFGCSVGLGGCDSSSPPQQVAYAWIFAPRVLPDGLAAIEEVDPSKYTGLRKQLEGNAAHKPVLWSLPELQSALPNYPPFPKTVIDTASAIFDKAVKAQWLADVPAKVLPVLYDKRAKYDNAQQIAVAAADAATAFKQSQGKIKPAQRVTTRCTDDFRNTFAFAHVDRWILEFPDVASKGGGVKSNADWCSGRFWTKNSGNFALRFHDYVKANFCPEQAGALVCQSLANYDSCVGLMGSVYKQQECAVNVHAVGVDVAKEIMKYFASSGSQYPCSIDPSGAITAPAVLRCKRPTQQYHCNKYYLEHYGSKGKVPMSAKVLDCALSKDASYQAKEDKVWNQAVPALVKTHPALKNFTSQKGVDPLVIGVSSQLYSELDADAKKYGLVKKTVMSFEPSIDGAEVGTLALNIGTKLQEKTKPVLSTQALKDGVNPPDPASKLGLAKAPVVAAPATGGGFVQKSGAGSPTSGAGNVALSQGAIGAAGQSLPKPATPLSAPAGISKGQLAVIGAQAKVEPNCHAPQAAVTVSVKIKNTGGLPAGGGGTVHIKEIGGNTNLVSAAVALPALKAGETKDLGIAMTSTSPYASLPGAHQLGVYLEPQIGTPTTPYQLSVTVPAGHCAQRMTSPAPAKTPTRSSP